MNQVYYFFIGGNCINMENGKTGRPKKNPNYSAEQVMRVLMEAVVQVYLHPAEASAADSNGHTQMKELCRRFQISNLKIRKLLVTAGVYQEIYQKSGQFSDLSGYIQKRKKEGATIEEIMQELSLSRSSIYSYLPYEWGIYQTKLSDSNDSSQNAKRHRIYRERKRAAENLQHEKTEEKLWDFIVAFQNYPFKTVSGLQFQYSLKTGRDGNYTRELWVDRRENSKSLAWSSIALAFKNSLSVDKVDRPKALGDIRGVSYIYPILWRAGVIMVPEENAKKMELQQRSIKK